MQTRTLTNIRNYEMIKTTGRRIISESPLFIRSTDSTPIKYYILIKIQVAKHINVLALITHINIITTIK